MAGFAALAAFETLKEQRLEFARVAERERQADAIRKVDNEREERVRRLRQAAEGKQLFERTFFNLLSTLHNIVQETDVGSGEKRTTSRDAFKSIASHFTRSYQNDNDFDKAWKFVIGIHKNDLNHYFRFLYHIVCYIDLQEAFDRYFYIRILRAGLSEAEIILLFANCAFGEGFEKFKPLVERYALLHNVSESSRKAWKMDEHYDQSAFEYGDY